LAPCILSTKARHGLARTLLFLSALAVLLAGCERETKAEAPQARPVRTGTAEKSELGEVVVLTGQIQAEKETALAFRIGGRIIERSAGVGDHVVPDQVLAKLDPQNELNALRSARAALSAAQGKLVQARNTFMTSFRRPS
jgi:membrane fusion protein, multidrug efflux system